MIDANLTWQETAMLRAYTKYLRQTGFNFSQTYIEQALVNNTEISKALVQLFVLKLRSESIQTKEKAGYWRVNGSFIVHRAVIRLS